MLTRKNVTIYIVAGFALHNYLQQSENASYGPRGFIDSEANSDFRHEDWRRIVRYDAGCFMCIRRYQGSQYEKNAVKMRDDLKYYVNSNEGLLPC